MSTTLLGPFVPPDTVPKMQDPITRELLPPRRTTTDEQERAAVDHALVFMLDRMIWKVALPVEWTRREPTTLTIVGHPEHLGRRTVAVFDGIEDEVDQQGNPVDRSFPVRFERLQDELDDVWEASDGL